MRTAADLRRELGRIDGRGYRAYRDIAGAWDLDGITLHVDHVQGDPFAAPSRVRLTVPAARSGLPTELWSNPVRRLALQDLLAREVRRVLPRGAGRGSGKSGLVTVDAGAQEVIERTAVVIDEDGSVDARLQVGLPAAGRSVLGRQAVALLCDDLPRVARGALSWGGRAKEGATRFVDCYENQAHLRARLDELSLVAFVADGALLPRESGATDRPLAPEAAVPFRSPAERAVEVPVPNEPFVLKGMGVPRGVTLIVGGGYHGKSTLLRAIERGVYAHVPGDGREYVVTCAETVKIRAEDGRRVERVDVSAFIGDLPYGRGTRDFSSDSASGSTSQAANIIEALEVGARVLLLDEDTSATNFMVRDARMQALVHRDHEPITPFVDRVRELYDAHGVSSVLVVGGCGDYFEAADTVIRMRDYLPEDATAQARAVAEAHPTGRVAEVAAPIGAPPARARVPDARSIDASRGRRDERITAREVDTLVYGEETIDLRAVEQLVDISQTRAIGRAILEASRRFMDGRATLSEVLDAVERSVHLDGLEGLTADGRAGRHPGNLALPRRFEIAAALNRLRSVRMRSDIR